MPKHFAEVVVQDILPAVRALVAKQLVERHKLTQQAAAEKIGVTQAAVSQYSRELRGWKVGFLSKDQDIMSEISSLSDTVAQSGLHSKDALKQLSSVCKLVKERHFSAAEELYPGLELCEPLEKN
jgi:predicted transcriptional regulator